jgi:DnaK suppressor protein
MPAARRRRIAVVTKQGRRFEEIRKRLVREYQTTAGRLRELGGMLPSESATAAVMEGENAFDTFDQIDASEARERHFATKERLVARRQRLAAALGRLDDGSYGRCSECGDPISPARLRAIPEVSTCVACQARLEHDAARRAQLN